MLLGVSEFIEEASSTILLQKKINNVLDPF